MDVDGVVLMLWLVHASIGLTNAFTNSREKRELFEDVLTIDCFNLSVLSTYIRSSQQVAVDFDSEPPLLE